MKFYINKFSLLAIVWFVAGIYSLIFKESGNTPPPFPNFDKVAHFTLFFAQIWLLAKSYIHEKAKNSVSRFVDIRTSVCCWK